MSPVNSCYISVENNGKSDIRLGKEKIALIVPVVSSHIQETSLVI